MPKQPMAFQSAPKVVIPGSTVYALEITFTEMLLAAQPAQPAVYREFIASKAPRGTNTEGEVDAISQENNEEAREQRGWSVFHNDHSAENPGGGIHLMEYHIKGFFKSACQAVTGSRGQKNKETGEVANPTGLGSASSKIAMLVFVSPRRLYLMREGARITVPDGHFERPLRAQTMQGPRVSLKRSDYLNPPLTVSCHITVLPLGQREISEAMLKLWLAYGEHSGFGEWRNGGHGRFESTLGRIVG
jgi:hypothetical protein